MILAQIAQTGTANQWQFGIAVCTLLGTLAVGIFTLIGQRRTAAKVETVHTLVNSQKGALLENSATYTEALAVLTGKPEYRTLADAAKQALTEHQKGQAQVDAAAGPPVKS